MYKPTAEEKSLLKPRRLVYRTEWWNGCFWHFWCLKFQCRREKMFDPRSIAPPYCGGDGLYDRYKGITVSLGVFTFYVTKFVGRA